MRSPVSPLVGGRSPVSSSSRQEHRFQSGRGPPLDLIADAVIPASLDNGFGVFGPAAARPTTPPFPSMAHDWSFTNETEALSKSKSLLAARERGEGSMRENRGGSRELASVSLELGEGQGMGAFGISPTTENSFPVDGDPYIAHIHNHCSQLKASKDQLDEVNHARIKHIHTSHFLCPNLHRFSTPYPYTPASLRTHTHTHTHTHTSCIMRRPPLALPRGSSTTAIGHISNDPSVTLPLYDPLCAQ
jgi:hypothetical protein